jgi:hypothetical protein
MKTDEIESNNQLKLKRSRERDIEHDDDNVNLQGIPESIIQFHKNISIGSEYICTCCDQLWYKSSVTKCNCALYESCPKEISNLCLTGGKSVDDTEWI